MNRNIIILICIVLTSIGIYLGVSYYESKNMKDIRPAMDLIANEPFPNVQLEAENNKVIDFNSLRKRKKVIFIISTRCQICNEKKEYFDKFAAYLQKQGIDPIVIYQDRKKISFKRYKNMKGQYRLLNDKFRLTNITPTMLLLDDNNKIVEIEIGIDENRKLIEKITNFE